MQPCLDSIVFAQRFPHLVVMTAFLELDMETVTDWKDKLFPTAEDEEFDIHMRTILVTIEEFIQKNFPGFQIDYPYQILELPRILPLFGLRTQHFIIRCFQD